MADIIFEDIQPLDSGRESRRKIKDNFGKINPVLKEIKEKDSYSTILEWQYIGSYINTSGQLSSNGQWRASRPYRIETIPIDVTGNISPATTGLNIAFYATQHLSSFISGYSINGAKVNEPLTIPAGTNYYIFSNEITYGDVIIRQVFGNTMSYVFPRMKNIDTRISLKSVPITRGGYLSKTGTIFTTGAAEWGYSAFIEANEENSVLHLITGTNTTVSATLGYDIAFFDNSGAFISGINRTFFNFYKIPYPLGATHYRISQFLDTQKMIVAPNTITKEIFLKIRKTVWCAIGDSITAGDITNTTSSYATVLASKQQNMELIKAGYYGHTMKESLATTAYSKIAPDTTIITQNFGSNDIQILGPSQWGDIDEIMAKTYEDLQDNASSFESLRLFIEKCRRNFPSIPIYVITPIKRVDVPIQDEFINLEKELCRRLSIPILDANAESGIQFRDEIYTSDGTHPNEAGKLILARWLASAINFSSLF